MFGGEKVRSYDLPVRDKTVFNLDTSSGGYTLELHASNSYEAESHEEFLRHLETMPLSDYDEPKLRLQSGLRDLNGVPSEATIGDRSVGGSFEELISEGRYPEGCSYLRVEAKSFDIEWEDWGDCNRVMLSGPGNDADFVQEVFEQFADTHPDEVADDPFRLRLRQATALVERDCEPATLSEL